MSSGLYRFHSSCERFLCTRFVTGYTGYAHFRDLDAQVCLAKSNEETHYSKVQERSWSSCYTAELPERQLRW